MYRRISHTTEWTELDLVTTTTTRENEQTSIYLDVLVPEMMLIFCEPEKKKEWIMDRQPTSVCQTGFLGDVSDVSELLGCVL